MFTAILHRLSQNQNENAEFRSNNIYKHVTSYPCFHKAFLKDIAQMNLRERNCHQLTPVVLAVNSRETTILRKPLGPKITVINLHLFMLYPSLFQSSFNFFSLRFLAVSSSHDDYESISSHSCRRIHEHPFNMHLAASLISYSLYVALISSSSSWDPPLQTTTLHSFIKIFWIIFNKLELTVYV